MPGQTAWPLKTASASGVAQVSAGQPSKAAQASLVATQCGFGGACAGSSVKNAGPNVAKRLHHASAGGGNGREVVMAAV